MDWDGIKRLLQRADEHFARLKHLWVDAGGYRGEKKGKEWVQKTLRWSVDLLERPNKPAPRKWKCLWHGLSSGENKTWCSIGRSCWHREGLSSCRGAGW